MKRTIWRRSENSSQLRLLGISLKKHFFRPHCNLRLNTKVTVTTRKKSHLGSSEIAADGTVYFNGTHEDTTCTTTHSPLRECIQYSLFNCMTHIEREVHCVAKLYLASTVANGICHFGATLHTPIRQISLPSSSTLSYPLEQVHELTPMSL